MSAHGTRPEIVAHHVWKKVDVRDIHECWPWLGARNSSGAGHGVAYIGHTKSMSAHRAVYQLVNGPIPDDLVLDHVVCQNPGCVNPMHCEPVPQLVNVRRGRGGEACRERCAAITHCPAGHEYTPENTAMKRAVSGYMVRGCRECGRIRSREYAARRYLDNISIG